MADTPHQEEAERLKNEANKLFKGAADTEASHDPAVASGRRMIVGFGLILDCRQALQRSCLPIYEGD